MASTWNRRAARLAALVPRTLLHPSVVAWADARPFRERWAVALSGGADSVCLLLLLREHWPRRAGRLCALHFNHRLRGAAAAADARFCRNLCRSLGIDYAAGAWTGPRRAAGEAAARDARFAFLGRAMAERKIGVLWLGHQQDDVAETLFMRLSRGSGTAGLAAPRPVQSVGAGWRVRPLLGLKKAEIVSALRRSGIPWREDGSNRGDDYFRNRIRNNVLGRWIRASGRDALGGAALSRELLEEDDRALETATDEACRITKGGRLDVVRLAGRPRAVVRRALYRWLIAQGLEGILSRQGFSGLLEAVERGRPTRKSLGTGGFAVIRKGLLEFSARRKPS